MTKVGNQLTLAEAARQAGATVHQVRTYVASGLVRPCATTSGGYLLFEERCVMRLRLITSATRVGMRIAEIGVLVRALDGNDQAAAEVARRSVAAAIGTRQKALRELQAMLTDICGRATSPATA
ncbi:MAG: MerR family transcriptional regulator [Burkholderiales bacterium]|jgi:DNA-binding transcriptional MerR regulator|nr:MerR family transcriptional regulator [Burkholderiales bacterium]